MGKQPTRLMATTAALYRGEFPVFHQPPLTLDIQVGTSVAHNVSETLAYDDI